jgi:hypothetical protein
LSLEEQIDGLKKVAMRSTDSEARKNAIDALAGYGERAVPATTEIINDALSAGIRQYGLNLIKKIKPTGL